MIAAVAAPPADQLRVNAGACRRRDGTAAAASGLAL